jgi:hypothetical protein
MKALTSRLPLLNIAAFVITLVINFLSQAGPASGISLFPNTIQDLANSRAVLFLPANYVFGIWGLIYTALGAYVIYQALPSQRNSRIHKAIGWWFIVTCVANSIWLVLFLYDLVAASTLAMLALLGALIVIYLRLGIGRVVVRRGEYWAVHFGFSVYLGWITVATVANIATALYQAGAETSFLGIPADLWTLIVMIVAAAIAAAMLLRHRDVTFAGVVVWALIGIFARPFTTEVYAIVSNQNVSLVNQGALVIAVVVLLAAFYTLFRSSAGGTLQAA